PNDPVVMETVRVANQANAVGSSIDAHDDTWQAWASAYEAALARAASGVAEVAEAARPAEAPEPREALIAGVLRGDAEAAPALVDALVSSGTAPESIVGEVLTPAIQRLGDAYGRGEVFLPQMMVAAEAMKAAVARTKTYLPESADMSQGRVVFATVKGDIHSIGKDICVSLLESQGFEVADLGVDVGLDEIARAAQGADAVCLSALMTTTLRTMAETVRALRDEHPRVSVLVGGAVVTPQWAAEQGAGYADDAPGCVTAVREAIGAKA
ncbi:MAG: cobalamin B12-binding domain-containing protein, partial [Coriobacteriales bacterium]|nr:cobalamin B12-binding domain-containing protein [Coriobacteriales bacterium]